MAEASGVVKFDDEEVLQFNERNKAANTVKTVADLGFWKGEGAYCHHLVVGL
jgi:hypothetical protein